MYVINALSVELIMMFSPLLLTLTLTLETNFDPLRMKMESNCEAY